MNDKLDKTERIADTAHHLRSPFFESITDFYWMHWGIVVAIICVIIMWFLLERTKTGFEQESGRFQSARVRSMQG